ncbi:MAG: helix-turn-helix domain-containing protein [Coleofasciculaceae cyanobacterium]
MILNYVYRIYPDAKQIELLNEWLETCRISYNYALRKLKDWIASRKCQIDRCSLESEYIMAADYPFPSYHQLSIDKWRGGGMPNCEIGFAFAFGVAAG